MIKYVYCGPRKFNIKLKNIWLIFSVVISISQKGENQQNSMRLILLSTVEKISICLASVVSNEWMVRSSEPFIS